MKCATTYHVIITEGFPKGEPSLFYENFNEK